MKLPNIKEVRKSLGMSQVELSIKAKVSQGQISKIENGIVDTEFHAMCRIFKALGFEVKIERVNE